MCHMPLVERSQVCGVQSEQSILRKNRKCKCNLCGARQCIRVGCYFVFQVDEMGEDLNMKKSDLNLNHCLIAGVTFLLPIAVLYAVILYLHEKFALSIRDIYVPLYKSLGLYDKLPRHVMAIGSEVVTILLVLLALVLVGWVVLRVLRKRRANAIHQFLANVPFVRGVFSPVKQAVDSLFGSKSGEKNRKVVRFAYPAEPYHAIGLVMDEIEEDGEARYVVVMPLTMSAGTGFLLTVPKTAATEIQVNATLALEHILSCGMVKLPMKKHKEEVLITGVSNLWDAVSKGIPTIRFRMTEEEQNGIPKEEKDLMDYFCKIVYGRVDAKARKVLKMRTVGSILSSLDQFFHVKWYNSQKLKCYSCKVDGEYIQLEKVNERPVSQ